MSTFITIIFQDKDNEVLKIEKNMILIEENTEIIIILFTTKLRFDYYDQTYY